MLVRTWCLVPVLAAVACAPPNAAKPYPAAEPPDTAAREAQETSSEAEAVDGIARYFDRKIDLQPFLAGFPYGRFRPSLETGKLFFYELGSTYTLRMLELPEGAASWDLSKARALGDVDWSKRSLWSIHHHAASDKFAHLARRQHDPLVGEHHAAVLEAGHGADQGQSIARLASLCQRAPAALDAPSAPGIGRQTRLRECHRRQFNTAGLNEF